mmetsp:Transcript_37224/g.37707  ORF Transcript_37224/g.37707 Transcript_37224/m.37707 type:complete len:113 (+) Transcript_37224:59-397(+)
MAKMLGFSNYAELSLAKKMAPSVETVTQLTELMAEKAIPAARKELAEITALARKEGGDQYAEDKLEKLMPWDTTFWVSTNTTHVVLLLLLLLLSKSSTHSPTKNETVTTLFD